MSAEALLQKLAVERCQYHLAQIRAVMHMLGSAEGETLQGAASHAMLSLIEAVERDLKALDPPFDQSFAGI
jgi:hypothetical protein